MNSQQLSDPTSVLSILDLGNRSSGNGSWREHGQAKALAARDIEADAAESGHAPAPASAVPADELLAQVVDFEGLHAAPSSGDGKTGAGLRVRRRPRTAESAREQHSFHITYGYGRGQVLPIAPVRVRRR